MNVYWEITVNAPFTMFNVIFLPGHIYRVLQSVYDAIQADPTNAAFVATAVIVPDYVPVS